MKKRTMPEWDGFGNKFVWILEQAKRLREERNGHPDRPGRIPDLRLYICGRVVDLPKVPLLSRTLAQSLEAKDPASVSHIDDAKKPQRPIGKKTGTGKA